jgi:hypothetical protein
LGPGTALPFNPLSLTAGADLFYFPFPQSPAFPESINGVGNLSSYGIRTVATGTGSMFLGMANPMNLLTNLTDDLPEGGWELLKLTPRPPNTPVGGNVFVDLGQGISVNFCSVSRAGVTAGIGVPNLLSIDPLPIPTGYIRPSNIYTIGSTAEWRAGQCQPDLAKVCVSPPGSLSHLFQLQFDRQTGGYQWVDITTTKNRTQLCGSIRQNFIGILAVMEPLQAVPTLSEWARIFLLTALVAAGVILLLRRPRGNAAI